jgi:hypothetical protein
MLLFIAVKVHWRAATGSCNGFNNRICPICIGAGKPHCNSFTGSPLSVAFSRPASRDDVLSLTIKSFPFILAFFLRRGGWGRFAIVLTAPLMAEAARFSNLLLSVRCSFFNQGRNLLRPGDINRVTGTLHFDHVALGSFGVPAFEVGIDDSVFCRY